jgi:hypothetical protein
VKVARMNQHFLRLEIKFLAFLKLFVLLVVALWKKLGRRRAKRKS